MASELYKCEKVAKKRVIFQSCQRSKTSGRGIPYFKKSTSGEHEILKFN